MKIAKSRLLQIIREEVELHEKNTFTLDESFFQEEDISTKQGNEIIDQEIEYDEQEGNLDEMGLELESEVEEDILFTKKKPHEVIPPKTK